MAGKRAIREVRDKGDAVRIHPGQWPTLSVVVYGKTLLLLLHVIRFIFGPVMNAIRRVLTISTGMLFVCWLIPPMPAHAFPAGQLYWHVDTSYPASLSIFYLDSASYNGAIGSLDYSCRQYSGSSAYSGTVKIHSSGGDYPAQKGGWCRNRTFIGLMDGAYYTAYLYCDGVKRDLWDDSPCIADKPIVPERNFGPCDQ